MTLVRRICKKSRRLDPSPICFLFFFSFFFFFHHLGTSGTFGGHQVVLCTGTDLCSWWGSCQLTYCLVKLYVVIDLWNRTPGCVGWSVWVCCNHLTERSETIKDTSPRRECLDQGVRDGNVDRLVLSSLVLGSENVSDDSCRSWFSFPLFRVNLKETCS